MSVFKRFRDAATGMFTTKADAAARPANTDSETVDRLKMGERRAIKDAIAHTAHMHGSDSQAYIALKSEILEVLYAST